MSPESKCNALKDRAFLFQKVRSFFLERNVLEVDTPLLSHTAPIDEHIDVMQVLLGPQMGYLHTSPEYAMKRLLTLGIGDIFQMGHVFREGEVSARHNPEFTMVEWYRHTTDFSFFIEETAEFIRLFLGNLPHKILSYRDAFRLFAQVDYLCAETEDLLQCIASHGIEIHFNETWDKDTLCYLIMSSIIEPHLGKEEILFLTDYPSSQAALAQTEQKGDEIVAKRFEIFHQGIELANGYLELIDPNEQRKRFLEANSQRVKAGKQALPLDELFLAALKKGMPSCCGVAVGFDRLMMLRHQAKSLSEVIAFAWDEV